jgi:DNA-directed RNA polymerase subunit RPC12/RpoP
MFDFFTDKQVCPSCSFKISPSSIRVSRHRNLKIYNCPNCKADFVKNKRSELFPVLEEGAILC